MSTKAKFTLLNDSSVTQVKPNNGQVGTFVSISGTNMFGGGANLVSITLAGTVVAEVRKVSGTYIEVRVAPSNSTGAGDIVLTANTGSRLILDNGWTYNSPSIINDVSPAFGQEGTRVAISGANLVGLSNPSATITQVLLGTKVATIVNGDNSKLISVIAQASDAAVPADVRILSQHRCYGIQERSMAVC